MNPSSFLERSVGDYRILSLAGQGGMGTVFKAKHDLLARYVAIKVLDVTLSVAAPNLSERFLREAKSIAQLAHCHIARFHAFFILDEIFPCIVMEWLDGTSLANLLNEEKTLSYQRAVNIALQLVDALNYAHQNGIVHRDLKPENVMLLQVPEPDYVKLVDFGLVKILEIGTESKEQKLTDTGAVLGTPKYMSPEQCRGQSADQRCDIYSLGCILYKMLTGAAPFEASSPIEFLYKHINEEVPKPSMRTTNRIPAALELAVMKCLEKNPDNRYQNMEELQRELATIANLNAKDESILQVDSNFVVNKKFLLACTLLVLVIGICAWMMNSTASQNRRNNLVTVPAKSKKQIIEEEKNLLSLGSGFRLLDSVPNDHQKTISDLKKLIPTIRTKSKLFLAYNCLGKVLEQENQHERALEALSKARELCKQDSGGYSLDRCVCDSLLAEWCFERKEFDKAKRIAEDVLLRLNRQSQDDSELEFPQSGFGLQHMVNDNTYLLACIAMEQKNWKVAAQYAKTTLELDRSTEMKSNCPTNWDYRAVLLLADLHLAKDEPEKAMHLVAETVDEDLQNKLGASLSKIKIDLNDKLRYRLPENGPIYQTEAKVKGTPGDLHHYAYTYFHFGEWYANHGELEKARKCFVQSNEIYEKHLFFPPYKAEFDSHKALLAEFDQKNKTVGDRK